jgi:hypothetical protein
MTKIYEISATEDSRWDDFVKQHAHTSVFHTPQWLGALRQTYGFMPIVFSTTPPGLHLQDGVVFCEVSSWLTGKRLVSLPFSDHCEPLATESAHMTTILLAVSQLCGNSAINANRL